MKQKLILIATLLFTTLACRPVITIGWGEILIVGIVLAFLIGPPLIKLYLHLTRHD